MVSPQGKCQAMFLSFSETSKSILGQLITTKSRIRLQKIYWNQLICMTLTIRNGWTYFKHLQVRVDQLIQQPNFIIIVIIWWDFVTGIFPPYSLLTNFHHGGFLSWWEFAVRPSLSSVTYHCQIMVVTHTDLPLARMTHTPSSIMKITINFYETPTLSSVTYNCQIMVITRRDLPLARMTHTPSSMMKITIDFDET